MDENMEDEQIPGLLEELEQARSNQNQANMALHSQSMAMQDPNLIQLQIETEQMLEKLEHFYRGDVQKSDEAGNAGWFAQDNKDLVTFNEFGVTSMMEIITKYIDKNTILSRYSEERIYEILSDLGDELILFILCNYEKIGMDTYFKKTKFRLIIGTTVHIIESAYRRAIHSKTLEEVNQSRIVSQTDNVRGNVPQQPKQKTSIWNRLGF